MKYLLTLCLIIISFVFYNSPLWAKSSRPNQSCIYNAIHSAGFCTFTNKGTLMGITTEHGTLNSIHTGHKVCYDGTTTIEKIKNTSLDVFLCNGGDYVLKDPTCYKTIKPGETLIVTGIITQSATEHLLKERCYIACNQDQNVN